MPSFWLDKFGLQSSSCQDFEHFYTLYFFTFLPLNFVHCLDLELLGHQIHVPTYKKNHEELPPILVVGEKEL